MDCTVCKGTGKQIVTVSMTRSDGTFDIQDPIVTTCIWCDEGQMDEIKKQIHQDYMDAWCNCEVPGEGIGVWNGRRYDTICEKCDKVLVAG